LIIGEQKPLQEITDMLESGGAKRILVLGCDSCMTVALAGGKEEVRDLAGDLRDHAKSHGLDWRIKGMTLTRQCERAFEDTIAADVANCDAVVSLGCSIGAQMMAEHYPGKDVIPGINTSNMGAPEKRGIYREKCIGCGDCTIHRTAGICVLTRCPKGLQNGPCGGSVNGKCEIDPDTDCAWYLVFEALKEKGKQSEMLDPVPPKDWSKSHSGGVRTIKARD
jgi:hypothetical protein